jgi:hypothetical protein
MTEGNNSESFACHSITFAMRRNIADRMTVWSRLKCMSIVFMLVKWFFRQKVDNLSLSAFGDINFVCMYGRQGKLDKCRRNMSVVLANKGSHNAPNTIAAIDILLLAFPWSPWCQLQNKNHMLYACPSFYSRLEVFAIWVLIPTWRHMKPGSWISSFTVSDIHMVWHTCI